MDHERRAAARLSLPAGVEASVNGVAVRLLNLSAIGALFEHSQRFPPSDCRLDIRWAGMRAGIGVRLVRTAITGRKGAGLLYETAAHFVDLNAMAGGVVAGILRAGQPVQPGPPREGEIAPPDEDTWTRTVNFLNGDPDDDLPYMRFRLSPSGWTKEYVADAIQPDDGFTLARSTESVREALVLQRAFETADSALRRQLRRGIEARLRDASNPS